MATETDIREEILDAIGTASFPGADRLARIVGARIAGVAVTATGESYYPIHTFAVEHPDWCYGANLDPLSPNYDFARVLQGFLDFMEAQNFAGAKDLWGVVPGGEWLLDYEWQQVQWNRYAGGAPTLYNGWPGQAPVRKALRMRSNVRLKFAEHAYIRSGALTTGRMGIFTNISEAEAIALVNAGTATAQDVPMDVEIEGGFWEKIDPTHLDFRGNMLGWVSGGFTRLRNMIVGRWRNGRAFQGTGDPDWAKRWEVLGVESRDPLDDSTGGIRPLGGAWLVQRCRIRCQDDAYQAVGPNATWDGTTHVAPGFTEFGDVIFRDCWGYSGKADLMKAALPWQNGAPLPEDGAPAPLTQSMPLVIFESITGVGGLTIMNEGSSGRIGRVVVSRCEGTSVEREAINIAGAWGGVGDVSLDMVLRGAALCALRVRGKVDLVRGRLIATEPLDYRGSVDAVQFWQTGRVDLDLLDIAAPSTSSNGATIGDIITVGHTAPVSFTGQVTPAKCGPVRIRSLRVSNLVPSSLALRVNDTEELDVAGFRPVPTTPTGTGRGIAVGAGFTGSLRLRKVDLSLLDHANRWVFSATAPAGVVADAECVGVDISATPPLKQVAVSSGTLTLTRRQHQGASITLTGTGGVAFDADAQGDGFWFTLHNQRGGDYTLPTSYGAALPQYPGGAAHTVLPRYTTATFEVQTIGGTRTVLIRGPTA